MKYVGDCLRLVKPSFLNSDLNEVYFENIFFKYNSWIIIAAELNAWKCLNKSDACIPTSPRNHSDQNLQEMVVLITSKAFCFRSVASVAFSVVVTHVLIFG